MEPIHHQSAHAYVTHIYTGVYSACFLQVTQTGEWNAIVMSVIASWWYQDSIFPCLQFVLKAASAGVWGAERWRKHEGRIILEGKISRICELDTRHRAEQQKTDAQRDKHAKCSLTRWHWRHTCLEGLSIEADMPENQTKRRQLRDTDVGVWFERVTETSICHFKSSLSANVDMSDPQSMFYTACTMCKGRQERLEGGRVETDRSTNLSCLLHPQKVGRQLTRRKKQRGFIYKSSEDLTEFTSQTTPSSHLWPDLIF